MLPKLLSLLGALLQVGQLVMDAYVRVRKIFPDRKVEKLSDAERRRLKELESSLGLLSLGEKEELLDLLDRLYR